MELLHKNPSMFQPDLNPLEGFAFADCERLMGEEVNARRGRG